MKPHSKLLTDLDKAGIEIAFTQSIADETDPELQKVKVRFTLFLASCYPLEEENPTSTSIRPEHSV